MPEADKLSDYKIEPRPGRDAYNIENGKELMEKRNAFLKMRSADKKAMVKEIEKTTIVTAEQVEEVLGFGGESNADVADRFAQAFEMYPELKPLINERNSMAYLRMIIAEIHSKPDIFKEHLDDFIKELIEMFRKAEAGSISLEALYAWLDFYWKRTRFDSSLIKKMIDKNEYFGVIEFH